MILIYMLGTDGAGKTTVAQRIAGEPCNGARITYLYGQFYPILMRPVKWAVQRFVLKGTNQFRGYSEYQERKRSISTKRRLLSRLYCLGLYLDHGLQLLFKITLARLRNKYVILDRYYLDAVVNAGVIQNNGPDEMLRDAKIFEKILPKASLHIFLDVSQEIAFSRKTDIPSVAYLGERKLRYEFLGRHYQFVRIDADRKLKEVLTETDQVIRERLFSSSAWV